MNRRLASSLCLLAVTTVSELALAVSSAEFYKGEAHGYGRAEASIRFAAGDGVVSTFFLWKDGSEQGGAFWNELDFEKVGADCRMKTNALYGRPGTNHSQDATLSADPCNGFHTYAFEWTPEAIVWFVDDVEVRRETGATAMAFADNASESGMQIRFNIWPGDASFGGNFSPSILPVHQYVDWVQFSSYENGSFTLQWREDFDGSALPSGWLTGNWPSPKNLSTHNPSNVTLADGQLVLSMTVDAAGGAGGSSGSSSGGAGPTGGMAGASLGGSAGAATGGSSPEGGESGDSDESGGCALSSPRRSRPNALALAIGIAAVATLRRTRRHHVKG
jgi:hypothetical protein